jgi:hypothetical protein
MRYLTSVSTIVTASISSVPSAMVTSTFMFDFSVLIAIYNLVLRSEKTVSFDVDLTVEVAFRPNENTE